MTGPLPKQHYLSQQSNSADRSEKTYVAEEKPVEDNTGPTADDFLAELKKRGSL